MNFTIPATSKRIITIVVATLAVISCITILTLSIMLYMGTKADPTLLTAYVGITTGSIGALTALLANTRTAPGTDADMPKATVIPDGQIEHAQTPTPVVVQQPVGEPVPVTETKIEGKT